MYSLLVRVGG